MQILETDRLIIRFFTLADAQFIVDLLNDSDWLRFIGNRGVRSVADARLYLERGALKNYKQLGYGFYMVERKLDGALMGMCGLIKRPNLADIDIGYAFLPQFRGQGYGLESADAVLRYAHDQLGFKRVAAITTLDNTRSIHLLAKLGLKFERTITWSDGEELKLFAIEF